MKQLLGILAVSAALAACGGPTPDEAQRRVTKFGPNGGAPVIPDSSVKVTEKLVQQQVEFYKTTPGSGFVEFQIDNGSGWRGMPPAGSLLVQDSGWTFDDSESWYAGQSCTDNPPFCQWHLNVTHDAGQAANGPSLVCTDLINTGVGTSNDSVNVPGFFPQSWDDNGTQWHTGNYSMVWDPTNRGQEPKVADNTGKCHWDFDPSHPVVIDLWWTSTFAKYENPMSPVSIPPLMWTTVFFHYTTYGTSYEYRAVLPGAFDHIGYAIQGG
jgi:hypothetical protein